jgi:hypothetical protein
MYDLKSSKVNHKVSTIKEGKFKKLWEELISSFDFNTN